MAKKKILFINQEISPYVPDNALSVMGRVLPQTIQEHNHEIRTFMPKWGTINERRGQLHEVIRLSGMNLIINDTDHIIKISGNPKILLLAFLTENDDQTLSGERVVQLTPSKDPNAVVEASKRIDKLNEALKPYHDKKRVVDSETKIPLVYKLHLAETL